MQPNHRARTIIRCICGGSHELCVGVGRGVPPELRCQDAQPQGFGSGQGGCRLPADLTALVDRELRDNLQECKRRGFVQIVA